MWGRKCLSEDILSRKQIPYFCRTLTLYLHTAQCSYNSILTAIHHLNSDSEKAHFFFLRRISS